MKPGGKRSRWVWIGVLAVLVLAGAWAVITDPLNLRRERLFASLPPPMNQLMTDLCVKDAWYYRLVTYIATSARIHRMSHRVLPATWENAANVSERKIESVNFQALDKLCALGTNAYPAIPALVECLQDPDEPLRVRASSVLCAIHAENDGRLAEALRSQTDLRRILATLWYMTDDRLYGWEVYSHIGNINRSRFAFVALGQCGARARPVVSNVAAMACAEHGMELRTNAMLCLGAIGPAADAAVPMLKQTASDHKEWPQIRALAAESLQCIAPDDPETLSLLKQMMADEHALVRVKAAMVLWRRKAISADEVLAVLNREAEHKLVSVRTAVMQGAAEMGTVAQPLKLKVEKCLAYEDERVRLAATSALAKIGG